MKVRLKVTKIQDTETVRQLQFCLHNTKDGEVVFKTQSTETRSGARQWKQGGIFAARRRISKWLRKHNAILIG